MPLLLIMATLGFWNTDYFRKHRLGKETTTRRRHSSSIHRQTVGMRVNVEHFYFLFFPKTKAHLLLILAIQNANFYNKTKKNGSMKS